MLYFAYGSNLDPDQMKSRCPGHQVVGMAVMHDHRMVFPLTSHDWGGGVAGVQMHHGAELWGMVFDLSDPDLVALDRYEGFKGPGDQHNLYDRETVFVELTRPDDGSFTRRFCVQSGLSVERITKSLSFKSLNSNFRLINITFG